MLMDYYTEAKSEVAKERASEVERLISTQAETHNEIVGRISAYDTAISILDEVLQRFGDNAEDAPAKPLKGRFAAKAAAQDVPRYRRYA